MGRCSFSALPDGAGRCHQQLIQLQIEGDSRSFFCAEHSQVGRAVYSWHCTTLGGNLGVAPASLGSWCRDGCLVFCSITKFVVHSLDLAEADSPVKGQEGGKRKRWQSALAG